MIVVGVGGLCLAVGFSEYTLWSTPSIDTTKLTNPQERIIKSDKVVNIPTNKGIFKDETLQ
ncbi:hypothetical protein OVS_01040 [Mycoplasma ovis str. Michigan]|uniref:Uncharacterized protein n=1 Tax=Mycoplasma ovis str. Michigan TaxID=1415773 RepID=A0ABM5P1J8_9MOLU|nr:hypothetical protein OVS_01040 [Mycoplasma ovis str. Michigan]